MVFDKTSGKTGTADTPTDQLSNKYSVIILGIFALVATTGNYFHQPISCYCPTAFRGSEIEFVERVCSSFVILLHDFHYLIGYKLIIIITTTNTADT